MFRDGEIGEVRVGEWNLEHWRQEVRLVDSQPRQPCTQNMRQAWYESNMEQI